MPANLPETGQSTARRKSCNVDRRLADSSMSSSLNVLVVDDELNIRKALAACLEADGHQVIAVGTPLDATHAIERRSFDLAFVDLCLGKDSALDLIPKLLAAAPWMKV